MVSAALAQGGIGSGIIAMIRNLRTGIERMSAASLLWGLLFGSIGVGFFIYGKRQAMIVPMLCGVALMVYPYFVSSTWLLLAIGIALMAIPYFLRY